MAGVITDQYDAHDQLDPLVQWNQNATCYSCLAPVARKYLATSVPAEIAFS